MLCVAGGWLPGQHSNNNFASSCNLSGCQWNGVMVQLLIRHRTSSGRLPDAAAMSATPMKARLPERRSWAGRRARLLRRCQAPALLHRLANFSRRSLSSIPRFPGPSVAERFLIFPSSAGRPEAGVTKRFNSIPLFIPKQPLVSPSQD